MTEPGGLQAWRLAAWMVILQPASDSKWICVNFIDLGVFWGEKIANRLHGSCGQKKPCNLGTSILITEPAGLQAWRLAAWIVILQSAAGRHGGSGSLDGDSAACE